MEGFKNKDEKLIVEYLCIVCQDRASSRKVMGEWV